jgi:hypothetical protein
MLHETKAPTAIHPRASTRHRFLRLAGIFPGCFLARRVSLPSRCPNTARSHLYSNQSFALRHWLAAPLISTQHHSNPIASGFLQVAVSKAPAHSHVIHDSSQARFRYSPKTFRELPHLGGSAHKFRFVRHPSSMADHAEGRAHAPISYEPHFVASAHSFSPCCSMAARSSGKIQRCFTSSSTALVYCAM